MVNAEKSEVPVVLFSQNIWLHIMMSVTKFAEELAEVCCFIICCRCLNKPLDIYFPLTGWSIQPLRLAYLGPWFSGSICLMVAVTIEMVMVSLIVIIKIKHRCYYDEVPLYHKKFSLSGMNNTPESWISNVHSNNIRLDSLNEWDMVNLACGDYLELL